MVVPQGSWSPACSEDSSLFSLTVVNPLMSPLASAVSEDWSRSPQELTADRPIGDHT